jgi:hypothetical protein
MGLEKEPLKRKLPPIFTGEAIEITFNHFLPNEKVQQLKVVTFPDWAHEVYVDDKIYKVLGKDLEIGMAFTYEGIYIPIVQIDKQFLYHGLQLQNNLGFPCEPSKIQRKKFKRQFKEDGTQYWEISTIEENTK